MDSVFFAQDEGIRHPAPATCIPLGIRIMLATLRDHPHATPPGPGTDSAPGMTDELAVALRGYWGVGSVVHVEGSGSEAAMEYFDIWS